MKLNTSRLPDDANLLVKCNGKTMYAGRVFEHDDTLEYNSGCMVRCRVYGMTPYEYGGTKDEASRLVMGGQLTPIGYRDLCLPDGRKDLPIDEEVARLRDDAEESRRVATEHQRG